MKKFIIILCFLLSFPAVTAITDGGKHPLKKFVTDLNSEELISTEEFNRMLTEENLSGTGFSSVTDNVQYAFMGFGKKDSDGDGIADEADSCPNEAEDFDGYEDDDGCAEADNDKDGIADKNDKCPLVAEDLDGYQDNDGCPDEDNDLDGIKDADDKCPADPEDFDGSDDGDGCPEYDNDGDGVQDNIDKCPKESEDFDGWMDKDGCPEDDNDADGIADDLDKCPNESESLNGFEDSDGCPDAVILKKDERIILNNIYFKLDSAELEPESFETLNSLKRIFLDNPAIIVQIEGHTDNQGGDDYNVDLSNRRAESVAKYIVEVLGVSSTQVSSIGYGESKPISTNNTSRGRAENRRIEFRVVSNGK